MTPMPVWFSGYPLAQDRQEALQEGWEASAWGQGWTTAEELSRHGFSVHIFGGLASLAA